MFKYYMFAFIKANLLTLLIIGIMFLIDFGAFSSKYYFWIWLILNIYFQCTKIGYKDAERLEDEWYYIKITEGKKWYHRYFDDNVSERLGRSWIKWK